MANRLWGIGRLAACLGLLALAAQPAAAQNQARPAAKGKLTLELNKIEPVDGACRIYMLLRNETGLVFDTLLIELVSFDSAGVISQRVAVDLAPLRAERALVKLFDVPETPCERVSQLLVNEAVQCSAGGTAVPDCLGLLATTSRAKVTFLD